MIKGNVADFYKNEATSLQNLTKIIGHYQTE